MGYTISNYTFKQARSLGVTVKPSTVKGKKIDVFRDGQKVASVGAIGYKDYPTYLKLEKQGKVPKGTADMKRKNYRKRHVHRHKRLTPAWYADKLLW